MQAKGFSIPELLTTISILVITVTVAIPSYSALHQYLEGETTRSAWVEFLSYGRSSAVHYESVITVCPMVDNECTDNFTDTWHMFTDNDKSKTLDDDETLVRIKQPDLSSSFVIYPSNRAYLRFYNNPDGIYSGLASSMTVCPNGKVDQYASHIRISIMGRISAIQERNADGIALRDDDGEMVQVSC